MSEFRCRLSWKLVPLVALAAVYGCGSATEPAPVLLQVAGTVRTEGSLAPVTGARVILADRRGIYDIPYLLGASTTDAAGQYSISAEARRPGFAASCEFVLVFVEGYENTSAKEVGCTADAQTIDLLILVL